MNDLIYADFHCHVDLFSNPPEIIDYFEKSKIFAVAVTTTPKAWEQNKKWTQNKKFVRPALGLHPQLIDSRYFDYALFTKLINESTYIGEIGLDRSNKYLTTFEKQKHYFEKILAITSQYNDKVLCKLHERLRKTAVKNEKNCENQK
jgi:TatD DNase family protein